MGRNKIVLAVIGSILLLGLAIGVSTYMAARDSEVRSQEAIAQSEAYAVAYADKQVGQFSNDLKGALEKSLSTGDIKSKTIEADEIRVKNLNWTTNRLLVGSSTESALIDIDGDARVAKIFVPLRLSEIEDVADINSTGKLTVRGVEGSQFRLGDDGSADFTRVESKGDVKGGNLEATQNLSALNGNFSVGIAGSDSKYAGQNLLSIAGAISATEFSTDHFVVNQKGDMGIEGSLTVAKKSKLNGGLEVNKGIAVKDGGLDVTGNTRLRNNLTVDGQTNLKNTSVNGALNVSGKTTLKSTDVGGALDVGGKTNLKNTDVDGALTAKTIAATDGITTGTLTVNNSASFGSNITVTGSGTFSSINSTSAVFDNLTVNNLAVVGSPTGSMNIYGGSLRLVTGDFFMGATGSEWFKVNAVSGNTSIGGTLDVAGILTAASGVKTDQISATTPTGTITVNSDATFINNVKLDQGFSISTDYAGIRYVAFNGPGTSELLKNLGPLGAGWSIMATPQGNPRGSWWVDPAGYLSIDTTQTSGGVSFTWFAFRTHTP